MNTIFFAICFHAVISLKNENLFFEDVFVKRRTFEVILITCEFLKIAKYGKMSTSVQKIQKFANNSVKVWEQLSFGNKNARKSLLAKRKKNYDTDLDWIVHATLQNILS